MRPRDAGAERRIATEQLPLLLEGDVGVFVAELPAVTLVVGVEAVPVPAVPVPVMALLVVPVPVGVVPVVPALLGVTAAVPPVGTGEVPALAGVPPVDVPVPELPAALLDAALPPLPEAAAPLPAAEPPAPAEPALAELQSMPLFMIAPVVVPGAVADVPLTSLMSMQR
jgi:hypothetical protein